MLIFFADSRFYQYMTFLRIFLNVVPFMSIESFVFALKLQVLKSCQTPRKFTNFYSIFSAYNYAVVSQMALFFQRSHSSENFMSLEIKPFSTASFTHFPPHSGGCIFFLFMDNFAVQNLLSLIRSLFYSSLF